MSVKTDGGPAFPCLEARNAPNEGMSLRDYFAAQALQAALAEFYSDGEAWSDHDDLAGHVYSIADAMLKARGEA